jgi:REP element-mobilizing transposase RayT
MVMNFRSTPFDYRRRLPHLQRDTKPLFVTFHTRNFISLPEPARDLAFDCCLFVHGRSAHLHAFVVMPEHVHLLLSPLHDDDRELIAIRDVLQAIKGVSAHKINRALNRRGPLWDEESFDHVLRSDESLHDKREYIRENPVRRGLAAQPQEYRWLWVNELDEV